MKQDILEEKMLQVIILILTIEAGKEMLKELEKRQWLK